MQVQLQVTVEQRQELETITEKLQESLQIMERKFEATEKKAEVIQAKLDETTQKRCVLYYFVEGVLRSSY